MYAEVLLMDVYILFCELNYYEKLYTANMKKCLIDKIIEALGIELYTEKTILLKDIIKFYRILI